MNWRPAPKLNTDPQLMPSRTVKGPSKIELASEATVGSHKQLQTAGSQQLQQLAATTMHSCQHNLITNAINIACSTQIAESTTWALHAIQMLAADSNHELSAVSSS